MGLTLMLHLHWTYTLMNVLTQKNKTVTLEQGTPLAPADSFFVSQLLKHKPSLLKMFVYNFYRFACLFVLKFEICFVLAALMVRTLLFFLS